MTNICVLGPHPTRHIATVDVPSPSSHPGTPLPADEQQLLDAIHAHPNKRDLVLNLLRQLNQSSPEGLIFDCNQDSPMNSTQQQ